MQFLHEFKKKTPQTSDVHMYLDFFFLSKTYIRYFTNKSAFVSHYSLMISPCL